MFCFLLLKLLTVKKKPKKNTPKNHTHKTKINKTKPTKTSSSKQFIHAIHDYVLKFTVSSWAIQLEFLCRIFKSFTSSLLKKYVRFVGPCSNSFIISSYMPVTKLNLVSTGVSHKISLVIKMFWFLSCVFFSLIRWHDDLANEERHLIRRGDTVLHFWNRVGHRCYSPAGIYPQRY